MARNRQRTIETTRERIKSMPRYSTGRFVPVPPPPINTKRKSTFGLVPLDRLRIDPAYQRILNTSWVRKHQNQFDPDRLGVLVVSLREDGFFYIIDGQHRFAMLKGALNPPNEVFAEIHQYLTLERESELFWKLDEERRNLTSGAQFKARLAAKEYRAVSITKTAGRVGITVDFKGPTPGNLRAYKTVEEIYLRVGEDRLAEILDIANSAWPNRTNAMAGQILKGIEEFLNRYENQYNRKHLIQVLSQSTPNDLSRLAHSIYGTFSSVISTVLGMTILALYNKNLRTNRLPDWIS